MYNEIISFIREWYHTDRFIPLHQPCFDEQDKEYVTDAIDSSYVSSVGEYVNRFEDQIAEYLSIKRAVATVNGTAALQVALRLVGVGRDDEVITQPLTFVATVNAIKYNNADPVFIDVDRQTLGLCHDALYEFLDGNCRKKGKDAINKITGRRIGAIVPMHTFGHPCRIDLITEIANQWDIPVVEDAAESIGSTYLNKHCGTFGKLGISSFNGNKTITAGGGGVIVTDEAYLANMAKHLTTTAKLEHPWEYDHDEIGYNYRMPNLNAALACAQLKKLPAVLDEKRVLAGAYEAFFRNQSWGDFIKEPANSTGNYWLNGVITSNVEQRDRLLQITNESGIMTRPIWKLMPDLKMYQDCVKTDIKNARWLQNRVVNLPSSVRKTNWNH